MYRGKVPEEVKVLVYGDEVLRRVQGYICMSITLRSIRGGVDLRSFFLSSAIQCAHGTGSLALWYALTPKYAKPPSYSSPTGIILCPNSCRRIWGPLSIDDVITVNLPPRPPYRGSLPVHDVSYMQKIETKRGAYLVKLENRTVHPLKCMPHLLLRDKRSILLEVQFRHGINHMVSYCRVTDRVSI